MSKKTARGAAAASDTPTVPLSTEALNAQLPCARKYFFAYALQAWDNCAAHAAAFAEESDLYTPEFILGQTNFVKSVQELPNNEVRLGEASAARIILEAARQPIVQFAERLRIAIKSAFKQAAPAELRQAGLAAFANTSPSDWGTTSDFITVANAYLRVKGEQLVTQKLVKADFAEKLMAAGVAFEAAWTAYRAKKQSADLGTKAANEGLLSILTELNPMMAIGRNHFKYDATLRKLFTTDDVVDQVRSKHFAAIVGFVRLDGKPLQGVNVQVMDSPDKSATTDKRGRYEISLAGGNYDLLFTAEGMEPLAILGHKVKAGVKVRLNVELVPVPVEEPPMADQATPSLPLGEPVLENPLTSAVSEMLEKSGVNGKANGVAV